MGFINLAEKTISAKLVYYGVGVGGKTTSLKVVHGIMCPRDEVKLVSINTEQDSTLLFDFLPIDLGQVEGFKIRVRGFTVPGQIQYVAMRKYVLSGADAVVLVIDSQKHRIEENLEAIEDLKRNLEANGLDWRTIPLIVQYNKRDLPNLIPEEDLAKHFQFREFKSFLTIATEESGVFEAFIEAVGQMIEEKVEHYGLGKGTVTPAEVAVGAKERLAAFLPEPSRAATPMEGLVSLNVPRGATVDAKELDAAKRKAKEKADESRTTRRPRPRPVAPTPPDESRAASAKTKPPAPPRQAAPAARPAPVQKPAAPPRPVEPSPPVAEPSGVADSDVSGLFGGALAKELEDQLGGDGGLLGQAMASNMELAGLYTELAEYKSLLERKNRELVEINQLISHDLRKPITVFKTVMGLLLGDHLGGLNDRQTDAVQNALEATNYMEELITDILEASRLDYDGVEFDFQDVDMTLLIGSMIRRLRYYLEEQRVRLRVEPLPVIQGDPSALQKVFMNLVGNAANYRDLEKDASFISISAEERGDDWVFIVADNGIGIPPDNMKTIWKKFSRGANTSSIKGTGLGLYIVREYIRGHGGDVWVESDLGKGTKFFLRLPKEPQQAAHSPVH